MDLVHEARFHGNGFIQVPLNKVTRMHIYDPDFKFKRVENARIHDHQFTFESTILVGRLFHTVYDVRRQTEDEEPHGLYMVDEDAEDGPLVKIDMCGLYNEKTEVYSEGQNYRFGGAQSFHDSWSEEFTITVMTKVAFEPRRSEYYPWVVALNDEVPDNAFGSQPSIKRMRPVIQKAFRMLA